MKVSVKIENKEVLSFDSTAVNGDAFGEALKQAAMQLYSKWIAGIPPKDHELKISED